MCCLYLGLLISENGLLNDKVFIHTCSLCSGAPEKKSIPICNLSLHKGPSVSVPVCPRLIPSCGRFPRLIFVADFVK